MAIGTRYSQEFKEDAVRYRLEHPEIALRKYNSMLTLIVHFLFSTKCTYLFYHLQ